MPENKKPDPSSADAQAQRPTDSETAPVDEIDRLRTELEDTRDHLLRTLADLENYRKRVNRDMDEQRRYANTQLVLDLLPVLDNLERAIEAAEKSGESAGMLQGVKMVAQQLESVLEQHGCVRIPAMGATFDPALHDAIMQQPSDDYPVHTVLQVARSGFRLHDRVVRAAQVIVSAPSAAAQNGDKAVEPDGGGAKQ